MPVTACTTCPDPQRLRSLLDLSAPTEEYEVLTAHLDSCESCQKVLEALATQGSPIIQQMAQSAREPKTARPADTSAFWPALRQLEQEVDQQVLSPSDITRADTPVVSKSTASVVLNFLGPAEEPGYLGAIDRFQIVETVGRGGMGIVLRAFDACLQRTVAVKVLDPLYAKNELAQNRFCREARAAAAVTHENVVTIHHVNHDEDKELSYIVMQFVKGRSLQERLDQGGALPLREAVRIAAQTASGLAAAHAQGLIHRDIKPGNILLEQGSERVLLTDFGLARAAEDVKLTQTGFVAGTPLYMSPEQARGEALDHRSDLFSLGGVLYAMLTGSPPFEGSSPFVVLRQVTEGDHRPVQERNPNVPDWLAEIVDRLLEKAPKDRFQSAEEVATLLNDRWMQLPKVDQPGSSASRRTSRLLPRFAKTWWGRHAGQIAATLVTLLGLLFVTELTKVTTLTRLGLRGNIAPIGGNQAETGEANSPVKYVLNGESGPVWAVAFSPDDSTVAMAMDDGIVKLWSPKTGHVKGTINAHEGPIWSIAYQPGGNLFATASDDGTVKLWDATTYKEANTISPLASVRIVTFSPDGKWLATGARNGAVTLWDAKTGNKHLLTQGHNGVIMSMAFSPNGKVLASASGDKKVKLWDTTTGNELLTLQGHTGGVYAVAFSPDGQSIATGSWDRTIRLWDPATGARQKVFEGHKEDIWGVRFSKDGKSLVSSSEDRTLKIWDVATGKEMTTLRGHTGTIYGLAVSNDGTNIASGSRDGTLRIWEMK